MRDETRRIIQALAASGADFITMRETVMAWGDRVGAAPCDGCGQPVLYAWDAMQERVALVPDDTGDTAVALDPNRIPWCRPAPDQLELGDELFRRHALDCQWAATVTPIGSPAARVAGTRGQTA
jgi:hypothetical protein